MPKSPDIDEVDRQILAILMNDANTPYTDIAKTIHVALNASQRTLKGMHDLVMAPWRGSERFGEA